MISKYFIIFSFVVAGIINLIPSIGVLSNEKLTSLYGVDIVSDDLALLLRHRAVLFLIVGTMLLTAAFVHSLRPIAGIAGLVSMISFILLAWSLPDIGPLMKRIVTADIVASLLLIAGLIVHSRGAHV